MEELYNGIVRLSDHASVQSMDNAIHRINLYLVDSALRFFTVIRWIGIYLFGIQLDLAFIQLDLSG